MQRLATVIGAMALMVGAFAAQGRAAQSTSLIAVAARDGYTFAWLLTSRSVSLYRPGIVVVLRPGDVLYDVNNHVEVADRAPVTQNGDLLISPTLAARLGELSRHNAYVPPNFMRNSWESSGTQGQGAQSAVFVRIEPVRGRDAITVSGTSSGTSVVRITLLAILSPDLPTVLVSRHELVTSNDGSFSGVIPLAADYAPGTVLQVVATPITGTASATAQLVIGQPNPGAEELP